MKISETPRFHNPAKGGVLGAFSSESALIDATARLRALRFEPQTYTPKIIEGGDVSSPLPLIALIGGLAGVAAGFVMQVYANVVAYPLDIGGRPKFSWPAFVPIAFEIGVLFAIVSAIIGAFVAGGLFSFYDPVDECEAMRRAMRDRWVVAVRTDDPQRRARARAILAEFDASDIEEIAA
jgi:hypothetical protein